MFFFEALSQFAEKAQLSRMNLSEVPSENTQPWIVPIRFSDLIMLQFYNYMARILPFLTPPPCEDSFYTLSVDKNKHF
jgi:hypothetical protein